MKTDKCETNSRVYKMVRRQKICDKLGKCPICPWHGGENAGFSRQPKDDRYKDKRKGR